MAVSPLELGCLIWPVTGQYIVIPELIYDFQPTLCNLSNW